MVSIRFTTTRIAAIAFAALVAASAFTALAGALTPDASAKTPKSFFGVVPLDRVDGSGYPRMAEANVHTLRQPLYWQLSEPRPSEFDFSRFDAAVEGAAKQGIRVVPYIYGTPSWVAEALDHRKCDGTCVVYPPRSTEALRRWRGFVRLAEARYGPQGQFWKLHPELHREPIRSWQIWNEQNSKAFFMPRPDVGRYAKLLKNASHAIRGRDHKADVILGGTFGTPGGDLGDNAISTVDYLRKLYKVRHIKRQFNGIALHPYSRTVDFVKHQVRLARRALHRARDSSADLWITEIGWASGGLPSAPNAGSELAQASRVTQVYRAFKRHRLAWGVRGVFWFSWQDSHAGDAIYCTFCRQTGLTDEQGGAKPALDAYRRVAR